MKNENSCESPWLRLIYRGGDALTDRELISIIIGSGKNKEGALELACQLTDDTGGISCLSYLCRNSPQALLTSNKKLGFLKCARLSAAFVLAHRSTELTEPHYNQNCPDGIITRMAQLTKSDPDESVVFALLGPRLQPLFVKKLDISHRDKKRALRKLASISLCWPARAALIGLSRPKNSLLPTGEEKEFSTMAESLLNALDISLLDIFIFNEEGYRSIQRSPRIIPHDLVDAAGKAKEPVIIPF